MNIPTFESNPMISVIIPVYNGAETLRRAIASVLKQTYPRFEILVIDDCSQEDLAPVVASFQDHRMIYLRHAKNRGAGAARNTGITHACGELLAFLDSDDEYLPEKLQRQVNILQSLPQEVVLVINNLRDPQEHRHLYLSEKLPSGYVQATAFPGSIFSPPSTWILRKKIVADVGLFDEAIDIIEDADYFVRILERFPVYYLNEVLTIKYNTQRRKGYFNERHFSGNEIFLKKHLARLTRDRRYFAHFYYLTAKDYASCGRPDLARSYFIKAFFVSLKPIYLFKCLGCK